MPEATCHKCGRGISNEFGVTLSFCTNCGAALNDLNAEKTLEPANPAAENKRPNGGLAAGLIVGAVSTLLIIGGVYFTYSYLIRRADSTAVPGIGLPGYKTVPASDITEVDFYEWRHRGLLYSGAGYVESKRLIFRRDGTAVQIEKKDFDDGKRPDEILERTGSVSPEQFERLARTAVENDFLAQTDSAERISEGDNSLTVKFSGGEKEVKTSNTGKDTPQIEAILKAIKSLQNQTVWKASDKSVR